MSQTQSPPRLGPNSAAPMIMTISVRSSACFSNKVKKTKKKPDKNSLKLLHNQFVDILFLQIYVSSVSSRGHLKEHKPRGHGQWLDLFEGLL